MNPMLTVVVPTLNRPELAKIAVDSVLNQDGGFSCEIILSNNGANPQTREIFNSEFYKNKVKYLETEEILPMTVHWEWATKFATGKYMMILPDRRLLKQGAVKQLILAMENNQDCEACCCSYDEHNETGRLVTTKTFLTDTKISTVEILRNLENGSADRNYLPLGTNCILRSNFLKNYRSLHGKYFDAIAPDMRSAFNFLFTANNVYVIAESLMITYGYNLSNARKTFRGDLSYWQSLGRNGDFNFMPKCFEGNIQAIVYEDFLRSKFFFKRDGDYRQMLSKSGMLPIMTEEMIKVVGSKFNSYSWNHYREVRKVFRTCGWEMIDDIKAMKFVFAGLKQFFPERIKRIYRYVYAFSNKKETDVVRVAGFGRQTGRTDA